MVNIFNGLLKQRALEKRTQFKKALIHFEARIGGQIFGSVPKNHRREFFCLDEHTWVWHEEWIDANGQHQAVTTRYDVRPSGIVKSQGHASYQALSPEELRNFKQAVEIYGQRVDAEYRRMLGVA
jgi:hypothetical protein